MQNTVIYFIVIYFAKDIVSLPPYIIISPAFLCIVSYAFLQHSSFLCFPMHSEPCLPVLN